MKLTEEEHKALETACAREPTYRADVDVMRRFIQRVLAEQEERDGPEKPTMDQLKGWCSWAADLVGCAGSNERALGLEVQEILAAVEEFMRGPCHKNVETAHASILRDTLSKLLR